MATCLKIGEISLYWLNGGSFELESGNMFGVVPKVLWRKKYPADPDSHLLLTNSPILVATPDRKIIIETGIGNKLTDKQKKIFRVTEDWGPLADLAALGLSANDIDTVVLTHCDFDHAGGIAMDSGIPGGAPFLTFPRARHYIQAAEWHDVQHLNSRSASTYFPVNFAALAESGLLELVDGDSEIAPGVRLALTGGHTRGHQAVWIESAGESALHLGDLLPNHAYFNPLWITPYDNFPLDSVAAKERLIAEALAKKSWFTFYHDPFMLACRCAEDGGIGEVFGDRREAGR